MRWLACNDSYKKMDYYLLPGRQKEDHIEDAIPIYQLNVTGIGTLSFLAKNVSD